MLKKKTWTFEGYLVEDQDQLYTLMSPCTSAGSEALSEILHSIAVPYEDSKAGRKIPSKVTVEVTEYD